MISYWRHLKRGKDLRFYVNIIQDSAHLAQLIISLHVNLRFKRNRYYYYYSLTDHALLMRTSIYKHNVIQLTTYRITSEIYEFRTSRLQDILFVCLLLVILNNDLCNCLTFNDQYNCSTVWSRNDKATKVEIYPFNCLEERTGFMHTDKILGRATWYNHFNLPCQKNKKTDFKVCHHS